MATEENQPGRVSRRDLLKKGAVAGGIVWTAPMLLSDVAGAQTSAGSPTPACSTYYSVKIDTPGGNTFSSSCGAVDTQGSACVPSSPTGGYLDGCDAVTPVFENGSPVVYLPATFNGKPIQNVVGYTKGGNDCSSAILGTALGDNGWKITFHQSVNGNAVSNIQLIFCI